MRVATSISELEEILDALQDADRPPRVSLVPTMGALHAGHRSLVALAQSVADVVVVTIFVNPLQFGAGEDYARYPRPLEDDLGVCEQIGVDVVFVPSVADLYPAGRQVSVSAGQLGIVLEGASRPGHFDGVLTVVLKLVNLVDPDIAVFGQKDAQQLTCIRRMVSDLNVDVDVIAAPTVRDSDGLAVSSRNRFLSPSERTSALALSTALRAAAASPEAEDALAAARAVLDLAVATGEIDLDYVALVDPGTMSPVARDHQGPATLLVAARVGTTRLIDNVELTFDGSGRP